MNKLFLKLTLVIFLLNAAYGETTNKLVLHFFGSSTCGECLQLKETILIPYAEKHSNALEIKFHDIDKIDDLSTLTHMEELYKVPQSSPQTLFFPDTFLTGFNDILIKAPSMIEQYLATPEKYQQHEISSTDTSVLHTRLEQKARSVGFLLGTLVAGIADGVNPCAIATMIFLVSFLATQKRKRSEILLIGLAYTGTVFITYFAMGIGLKGILEQFRGYHLVSTIIRWSAFILALGVAAGSFKDAITFRKTRNTKDITLQLPKAVKMRIHSIISGNLSGKKLITGSIIAGFLVTLLEAICTGQMYIPYIVAMTQNSSLRITGYLFLALYNILFVLPLLLVMILAYYGMKWSDLAKKTQKNMVLLKCLLGLVMLGLAIYLGSGLFHY